MRTHMRVVAASLLACVTIAAPVLATPTSASSTNPLERKVVTQLRDFTDWLTDHGHFGRGYVGEVGWPDDDARWNELAARWYRVADRAWLWASVWSAGEWWPEDYPLVAYGSSDDSAVDHANGQAAVIEAQAARKRSVNVAGAEFGTPGPLQEMSTGFSSRRLGEHGRDYRYPRAETFRYLASRGITTVRLPFRWERIQPSLGGALEEAELDRLRGAVADADAAGLDVILDVHNYGAYWQSDRWGTGWRKPLTEDGYLRIGHFADLWERLAEVFGGSSGVVAYGLMNEPVGLPGGANVWETASQAAVDAIRAEGDATRVMVAGYPWSSTWVFPENHPEGPWIRDPVGNTFYEAHHYFDCDNSGTYAVTYDEAVDCADRQGY